MGPGDGIGTLDLSAGKLLTQRTRKGAQRARRRQEWCLARRLFRFGARYEVFRLLHRRQDRKVRPPSRSGLGVLYEPREEWILSADLARCSTAAIQTTLSRAALHQQMLMKALIVDSTGSNPWSHDPLGTSGIRGKRKRSGARQHPKEARPARSTQRRQAWRRLGIVCKTHPTAECRNGASRGCLFGPAARHEPVRIIGSPARQKGPSHWLVAKRSTPLSVPIPVKSESAAKYLSLYQNVSHKYCEVGMSTIRQDRASRPRGGILITIELSFRCTGYAIRLRRVLREPRQLHEY
jgi:hypothetical protein